MSDVPQYQPLPFLQTEQNYFLSYLAKQNIPVFIFLKNGVKLKGFINGFDSHTIFLRTMIEELNTIPQMIYKQAISTISGGCLYPRYISNNTTSQKESMHQ